MPLPIPGAIHPSLAYGGGFVRLHGKNWRRSLLANDLWQAKQYWPVERVRRVVGMKLPNSVTILKINSTLVLVPGTGIEPVRLAPRDFRHTSAFAASRCCSCAGLCLHRGATRCRCPPSSLYTFLSRGSARRCLGPKARGFAEFEGIHAGAFASRCSMFKSLVSTNFTTQAANPWILPQCAQRVKCAEYFGFALGLDLSCPTLLSCGFDPGSGHQWRDTFFSLMSARFTHI